MAVDQSDVAQLESLRKEIRAAEAALASLHLEISRAGGDEGLVALHRLIRDNERLQTELQDLTRRAAVDADSAHAALQEAIHVGETDPLTQLPNRAVLWSRLGHQLALAKRRSQPLAVLFLDINDFKGVNDRLGHPVGDQLLRHVAQVIKATVRDSDTVCRLGGDEFVVVADDVPVDRLERFVEKIQRALSGPIELGGEIFLPSVSIGASSFPEDGDDAEHLVKQADARMYADKRAR